MLTAVFVQAAVTLLAATLAGLIWGTTAAVSLAAGGGSVVIPNALLALRLLTGNPAVAPVTLLIGEFVKIALSIGLIWLSTRWIEDLSWGALIAGLVLALKSLLAVPWLLSVMERRNAPG